MVCIYSTGASTFESPQGSLRLLKISSSSFFLSSSSSSSFCNCGTEVLVYLFVCLFFSFANCQLPHIALRFLCCDPLHKQISGVCSLRFGERVFFWTLVRGNPKECETLMGCLHSIFDVSLITGELPILKWFYSHRLQQTENL